LIVSIIVATDETGGIGKDNRLPWYLPSDLKRFKRLTMGHHLIMGRKTYETIGTPLPGREMILVTNQSNYICSGCTVVNSLDSAIQLAKDNQETEAFIIGGGEIFRQSINIADKIYLTTVHAQVKADVYFPELNLDQWEILEQEEIRQDMGDNYQSDFKILLRKD
jgi:dihydrofolate reductase